MISKGFDLGLKERKLYQEVMLKVSILIVVIVVTVSVILPVDMFE